MRYKCSYNPERDIQATLPDLALDLENAIETGVVVDGGTVVDDNGISDPLNIRGRIRDAFDAIEHQRSIRAALNAPKSAEPAQPSTEGA